MRRNECLAEESRRILDEQGVKGVDVMGAVGSGKTALIEALADRLRSKYRISMVDGWGGPATRSDGKHDAWT
ncbi:MAG: hypothetical protein QW057_10350 [Candidatus Bathyarchaeia archaeon]